MQNKMQNEEKNNSKAKNYEKFLIFFQKKGISEEYLKFLRISSFEDFILQSLQAKTNNPDKKLFNEQITEEVLAIVTHKKFKEFLSEEKLKKFIEYLDEKI